MAQTLETRGPLGAEVVHHYESGGGDFIFSTGNRFRGARDGEPFAFDAPLGAPKRALSGLRLARRALRIDKGNAVFNRRRDGVAVLYDGRVHFYDLASRRLVPAGRLRQCRNILHRGIAVTDDGLYFGEYGANREREAVPVWRSTDDGRSWRVAYEFPAGSIKHVHGVFVDPHSDRLWLPTGDFAGECYVVEANRDFSEVTWHGDGTQRWRPVGMFFEPERIVWPMDSQLETSYLQVFDRATGTLARHRDFPGPVWYTKRLDDGVALLQTTVEIGDGVKSDRAHVFASRDLLEWTEVGAWKKDRWPMRYFKFGVLAFADGAQSSDDFALFGEGLEGIDGRALRASLRGGA